MISVSGMVFIPGKYKTLINVPISIASALAASSRCQHWLRLTRMVRKRQSAHRSTQPSVLSWWLHSRVQWEGVFLHLQSYSFCPWSSELAASMLQLGAVSIVFFSLSTLSNGLLQGINRMREPVKNALIALVLHIGLLVVLMYAFQLNIYAVVYANAFFWPVDVCLKCILCEKIQRLPAGNQTYLCDTGHFCAHYGCCSLSVVSACIISLSCECDRNRIQYFDRCDRLCSGSFAAKRTDRRGDFKISERCALVRLARKMHLLR